MAKKKNTEATETTGGQTLRDRILTFFQTQPYRQPATLSQLSVDLPDFELKGLVSDAEIDGQIEAMKAANYTLPKGKGEQAELARQKIMEGVIDSLVKDGVLLRSVITTSNSETGAQPGMGYVFNGKPDKEEEGRLTTLPIDQITVVDRIQQRAKGVNPATVDKYAAVADRLPAIRVYHTPEDEYILSRGFHRHPAMRKSGMQVVPVEIFEGTREDALRDAIADNASHGLPRTSEDIRKAVRTFLTMKGNSKASVASVAKAVRIAWATAASAVKAVRRELAEEAEERKKKGQETPEDKAAAEEAAEIPEGFVKGAGGKLYPVSNANAGQDKPAAPATPPKEAPKASTVGVKDRVGNDVPAEVAGAFHDLRFTDAVRTILANVDFVLKLSADGYEFSSLSEKDRRGLLIDMEDKANALLLSAPYAVAPANAGEEAPRFKAAADRGWFTSAEYADWAGATAPAGPGEPKKNGRKRKSKAAEEAPAADSQPTEAPVEPAGEPISQGESLTDASPAETPADETATAA